MEKKKGADPKLIVAVQMTSIGIILIILGITVFLLSPIRAMEPFIRLASIISNSSITAVGLFFAVWGFIRYRRVKRA